MMLIFHSKRAGRLGTLLFSLLAVVAVVAGALPTPAQAAPVKAPAEAASAAVKCATTYIVQEGDTTVKIAQRYGIKWRLIAEANGLKAPFDLEAGDSLCIPEDDSKDDDGDKKNNDNTDGSDDECDEDEDEDCQVTDDTIVITVNIIGNNVTVNLNKPERKSVFVVKARATATGIGGWAKLGRIQVAKNKSASGTFSLPASVRDETYLSICLKNSTTDELICRSVLNP